VKGPRKGAHMKSRNDLLHDLQLSRADRRALADIRRAWHSTPITAQERHYGRFLRLVLRAHVRNRRIRFINLIDLADKTYRISR